eukprot:1714992-Rhodomonas_salina.2
MLPTRLPEYPGYWYPDVNSRPFLGIPTRVVTNYESLGNSKTCADRHALEHHSDSRIPALRSCEAMQAAAVSKFNVLRNMVCIHGVLGTVVRSEEQIESNLAVGGCALYVRYPGRNSYPGSPHNKLLNHYTNTCSRGLDVGQMRMRGTSPAMRLNGSRRLHKLGGVIGYTTYEPKTRFPA